MPNFCNLAITGHVGNDVELRYTPNGSAVCTVSIAVNSYRRDAAQWYRVTLWGKMAERANEHVHKGSALTIVANDLHVEEYETANGDKRYSLECTALDWAFAGSLDDGERENADNPF